MSMPPIKVTHKYGLMFNTEKCNLKAESFMFFSCLYDCKGVCSDPAKVNVIADMAAPTSVKDT